MALWTDRNGLAAYKTMDTNYYYLAIDSKVLPRIKPYLELKQISGIPYPDPETKEITGYIIPARSFPHINNFLYAFHLQKRHELATARVPIEVKPRKPDKAYEYYLTRYEEILLLLLSTDKTLIDDKSRDRISRINELRDADARKVSDVEYNDIGWTNEDTENVAEIYGPIEENEETEEFLDKSGRDLLEGIFLEYMKNKYGDFKLGDIFSYYVSEEMGSDLHVYANSKWIQTGRVLPGKYFDIPKYSPTYWSDVDAEIMLMFNVKDPNIQHLEYNQSPSIPEDIDIYDKERTTSVEVTLYQPLPHTNITKFIMYYPGSYNTDAKASLQEIQSYLQKQIGYRLIGSDDIQLYLRLSMWSDKIFGDFADEE